MANPGRARPSPWEGAFAKVFIPQNGRVSWPDKLPYRTPTQAQARPYRSTYALKNYTQL